ncbi:serine/threonine-protein kinase [Demequina flava]|uniref:serine/threonine-protein kinase n=1 Tax=Demequina flava TaxID=1095025 RepID=UPI000783DC3A|nr:serine/threonine-protein kinase [Demequina flava]
MASVVRDVGEEIGGYRIVDQLGRGGSGAVYKVLDGAGSEAALKLVDSSADAVAVERLAREVRALQSIAHPAIPAILDAELDGDETFVVFEYIPGVSLWDHIQDHGPMRGDELAAFADRTASALEAVHATGAVHRDVTPSNIMISPDGPVLIDFGLAHKTTDNRLTRDGLVSGTAGYVAPEVIDGQEPGADADRWAWAASVAFAMTGKAPFGSGTGAISRTLETTVVLPDVPGADAVRAALGRKVDARPGPRDVVAALRGATVVLPVADEVPPTAVEAVAATSVMGATSPETFDAAAFGTEADDDGVEDMVVPASSAVDTGAGSPADDYDKAEPSGEILPRAPRRKLMIAAITVATASAAALAPFIAFAAIAVTMIVARAVQRRALALAGARARKGQRRGDAALHTLGLPWHLLRAAGEQLPSILLAAAVALGVTTLGWWLVDSQLVAGTSPDAQVWAQGAVLMVGGIAAAATMWWGPWSELSREGAHRLAAGIAPSRGPIVAWVVVSFLLVAVVCLSVYLLTEPWWWPAPGAPLD